MKDENKNETDTDAPAAASAAAFVFTTVFLRLLRIDTALSAAEETENKLSAQAAKLTAWPSQQCQYRN